MTDPLAAEILPPDDEDAKENDDLEDAIMDAVSVEAA